MDHLKLPASGQHPPLVINYACTVKYDLESFLGYPERCGWSQSDLLFRRNWTVGVKESRQGTSTNQRQSPTSFLQNWLFFGLLHEVLGHTVQDDHFIRFDGDLGGPVLTTARLLEHVSNAMTRWQKLSTTEILFRIALVDRVLTKALHVLDFVCHETTVDPAIMFSFAIIGDFLTYIRNAALWAGKPHAHELITNWPSGDRASDIVLTRMVASGWCESHFIRAMRLTPSARYFVSQLEAPEAEHGHASCTKFRCLGFELDLDTYKSHHIREDCTCESLFAPAGSLTEMLSKDEIPVIAISQLIANDYTGPIPLITHTTPTSYVAISHVWSDHRGNPRANALPTCQLRFLADCMQRLFPDTPVSALPGLWIDTICCPVGPRWARERAIILMRETYSAANKVLIIENYILRCNFPTDTVFEPFARMYMSTWVSRLWTLQEGIVAKNLFIQFANVAVDFEKAWRALLNSREALLEIHNNLAWPVSIRGGFSDTASPYSSIYNLRIAVHERFTTRATDEPICLGTLIGVDMEKLLAETRENRMQRFWSLLPHIPTYVVFWTGKRLKDRPGFGWAPASFLDSRLHTFPGAHKEDVQGQLTDDGLRVRLPGVRLTSMTCSHINRHFWLQGTNGAFRYWFHGQWDPGDQDSTRMMKIEEEEGKKSSLPHVTPISLAIITERPLHLSDTEEHGTGDESSVASVLVKIVQTDALTLYASIIMAGTLYVGRPDMIPATDHAEALFQSILLGRRKRSSVSSGAGAEPAVQAEKPSREGDAARDLSLAKPEAKGKEIDEIDEYEAEYCAPEATEEFGPEQSWCIV